MKEGGMGMDVWMRSPPPRTVGWLAWSKYARKGSFKCLRCGWIASTNEHDPTAALKYIDCAHPEDPCKQIFPRTCRVCGQDPVHCISMPEELPLPCEYVLREHCSGAPRRILGRAEGRDSHGNATGWRAVWPSPQPADECARTSVGHAMCCKCRC
ncbi:hypothetical protein BGZ61DRAFT_234233 [Ilyonectria robusta]|uniref:uncharacterized protein n=1 Tax=Ilyonectria robusta TaxID=1079257 RepID=UPI001E8E6808|nr:uncharacterized protein BGZ61DRAFT_234233 [Ilyonectria robusta]KAH8699595.1 hypothetical protein BGZ61DRAFT_234233 [Ilyonectria robusta]